MANPNPDTSGLAPQWKKGECPNPGGKTSEQRKNEIRAAEIAAKLRVRMLEALDSDPEIMEHLDAATLKLFKDSEDRAHGTPKQTIDNTHDLSDPLSQLLEQVANAGRRIGDS